MTSSNSQMFEVLQQLFNCFILEHKKKYQCLPKVEFDNEWVSLCQEGKPDDDGFIQWQPVQITKKVRFDNVERGLNTSLNKEYIDYFSCFFSESLPVSFKGEYLELLFAWSEKDIERLQENIIGHVLMKQKLKQDVTLFFAVTDRDDTIISVNNSTGEVWLERVGAEPHEKLSHSIHDFLSGLTIEL